MGIKTLGDIKKFSEKLLLDRLGKFGTRLIELSSGKDHSEVRPYAPNKSVSSECTLGKDTRDIELLKTYLLKQAEEVARQLRKANVKAKTITLGILVILDNLGNFCHKLQSIRFKLGQIRLRRGVAHHANIRIQ